MKNIEYYRNHSLFTDPGEHAFLYNDLPDTPADLTPIIQGQFLHYNTARRLKMSLGKGQRREQRYRTIGQRLEALHKLSPEPLTTPRERKEKQVAWCRDFALFLVSMLRSKGIPARMRVGFESYFQGTEFQGDHWITEYWDDAENRWRLIDPDVGGMTAEEKEASFKRPLKPGLDFTDLRHGTDFNTAGRIWKLARAGDVKPELYRANKVWRGWPCLRGNLMHEFQSLNKTELTLWDYWDDLVVKPEGEINATDLELMDKVAELVDEPDENFEEMRGFFEELPRTKVIRSRLRLLGLLEGKPVSTAEDFRESDMDKLLSKYGDGIAAETPDGAMEEEAVSRKAEKYSDDEIVVLGARQNNLKNIDVRIPRNKIVVITGVSGSGKSSLAFDTIYAEGQRRYMENLSTLARQFTRQIEKPQVDKVIGLNPSVAIEQKTISPNSRSTVGSMTGVIDYLRVLFARVGQMHCPECGRDVTPVTAQKAANLLLDLPAGLGVKLLVRANLFGSYDPDTLFRKAVEDGFKKARIDGEYYDLEALIEEGWQEEEASERIDLVAAEFHTQELNDAAERSQRFNELRETIEQGYEQGRDMLTLLIGEQEYRINRKNVCPECEIFLPRLEPALMNPNTVYGMCYECDGKGLIMEVDPDLIISKPEASILDDATDFFYFSNLRKSSSNYWRARFQGIAEHYGADLETAWKDLPEAFRKAIIFGTDDETIDLSYAADDGSFAVQSSSKVEGAIHIIKRLYRQTKSENQRQRYMQFMSKQPCPVCQGERLSPVARFIVLGDKRFPEITSLSIRELREWVDGLDSLLDARQREIGAELLLEIRQKLRFICEVGLGYLNLDRSAPTLSGGEAQRIKLASQVGSELVGVLFVLDEPSVGLHSRDQEALLELLQHLRDEGNTILMVEHDADAMRKADWLIDIGPGAGVNGGELVAEGTPQEIMANPASITGRYLSGEQKVANSRSSRRTPENWLTISGANLHNLRDVTARIPLNTFTCITGVSGSGKSSLITQTLSPALARLLGSAGDVPGGYEAIEGHEAISKVIHITQQPIGRNPRSNPATYVGLLNEIRKLFAKTDQAKEYGIPASHFSFNAKGGRCEACEGYGANKIKMHFMADIWVKCPECNGARYSPQVLEVTYNEKTIADVLDMDVNEAYAFFAEQPRILPILQTLVDVGLGYIKLGQSAVTLSGGEAQRIKLAKELGRKNNDHAIYILDEPTTGLHFADIQKLLDILHSLVEAGNTVMVIEHNLDVASSADWVIDLGPEGGDGGGRIVAEGTPEDVAQVEGSHTGRYLKGVLG